MYDTLTGDTVETKFLTFEDLILLGKEHPEKVFRFLETNFFPQEIISWRGSYHLPAIKYSQTPITGKELVVELECGLARTHCGYKGGEYEYYLYEYDLSNTPYLVYDNSSEEEYKICGYILEDCEVILLTKIDPD